MRIQPIQNTNIYFTNNSNNTKVKPVSPAKDSLKTAGLWLGFGLGFDFLTRRCVIFKKSPTKNSLAVNGILALLAGTATFIKDSMKPKSN